MQGPGRPDIVNVGSGGDQIIVNAGSWESRYSECRVLGRPDIVNAGSGETRYSVMQGPGRPDIVNAGSWGDQI
ncbi:unnamed protein product [Staurois parvus]|uniref:Uncharacterized protein n=1 Tax=Staurois parvus TaxID=386267 RepID=A0ABN9F765_9NEOB|nr:unnamed protein product [Staurois parvus]